MPKYVLSYRGNKQMPSDEGEVAEIMAAWGAWFGSVGEALVDGGNPFSVATSVASDGSVGAPIPNELTGYSIVNAADLDGAVAIAKGCPVLGAGGIVDVNECVDM